MCLPSLPPETLDAKLRSVYDTIVGLTVRGQPQIVARTRGGAH